MTQTASSFSWSTAARAFALGLFCIAGATDAQSTPAVITRTDLSGIWWNPHPQGSLKPMDGGAVPLTAAGKAAQARNAAELRQMASNPVDRNDMRPCRPVGPTRILLKPYPFQIVQHGDVVVFLFEHNHVYETVYFHEKQDPDPNSDPTYMGYSVGTWTKDGMSVRLTNFNDQSVMDDMGLPHGEKLEVDRQIRKTDGGNTLEIISTIIDPEMYTRPWRVRQTFAVAPEGTSIEEYTCGQGPTLETRYTRRGQKEPS